METKTVRDKAKESESSGPALSWNKRYPERFAASMRRYRAKRKEKNLCIDCNAVAIDGKRRCKKHLEYYARRQSMYQRDQSMMRGYYQSVDFGMAVRRMLE